MTLDKNNHNDWNEWSNKVLSDLKQYRDDIKEIHEKLNTLRVEIAVIKAKSAMWGAIAGVVVSPILSGLLYFLIRVIHGG